MKNLTIIIIAILFFTSCEKSVEPVEYADVKIGLSLNGGTLSSTSFSGRINTDVTLWNHILSPTKEVSFKMIEEGGMVIERIVTYAELAEMSFSLKVGTNYIAEIFIRPDSDDRYAYDGIVVYGSSETFTVQDGVAQEIIINCQSSQWLVLVDKELIPTADIPFLKTKINNAAVWSAPINLYETEFFYYIYQGESSITNIQISVNPDAYEIANPESNTIYYVSYAKAFSISVGLGLPSFTKVIGMGG